MRLEVALAAGLFIISASCSDIDGALHHRRHADVHEQMRRDAEAAASVHQLQKRVDVFGVPGGLWPTVAVPAGFTLAGGIEITPVPGSATTLAASVTAAAAAAVPTLANGSIDATAWNTQAETACMNAMMNLTASAENPSGLAVCYNVPYLDQTKGLFEAELRMYNVSAPSGGFVGVTPDMMMVTLQYAGATIQASNGSALPVKRSVEDFFMLEKRQGTPTTTSMTSTGSMMASSSTATPTEVAIRKYVGAINANLLTTGMNLTSMQPLLVPQISIEATNPTTSQVVNTSLDSSQSSFVAGFFSKSATLVTNPKDLLGHPAEQIAAAEAGNPTPFVVPGLSLNVTPIGLVVTCIWTIIFSLAVGLGTFGRIQYREEYRKAIKSQQSNDVRRF